MKDYLMFSYDYIFGDHMAKCSQEAKLYYIKLMFFANNGFVANPLQVLDSLGYDKGVYQELVDADEILTIPGRSEVFITAYFIHTRFKPMTWLSSPFSVYWRGKLFIKPNGVATFKKDSESADPLDKIVPPGKVDDTKDEFSDVSWDELLSDIEVPTN